MAHAPIALLLSLGLSVNAAYLQPSVADFGGEPESDASSMSDEEKLERAKALYAEGDEAFKNGNFKRALAKFEEAYNVYAPNIHIFNINIGLAAYEAGDCVKAKHSLQRFLDLVPEHDARTQAQETILEIERSQCDQVTEPQADPAEAPTVVLPVEDDDDAPLLTSQRDEREDAAEDERRQVDASKRPMLIAGAVLTGVGGAALIGGAITLGVGTVKTANDLSDLASAGPSGYPAGNYADPDTFDLDRNKLPAYNATHITLFAVGGAALAAGIPLLIIDVIRKKNGTGRYAHRSHNLMVGPAPLHRGGGAFASARF